MSTLALPISRIEDALDARGLETRFSGSDDYTSFTIASGSKELEILDAASGSYYRPEHLTEAILYGATTENVTQKFEDIESVEEFLAAVAEVLS
jgi:hypothetical protein